MSNEANKCFCMSGMLVNQFVTSDVFFHWLSFVVFSDFRLDIFENLFTDFPSSLFAGFMRRLVGWLAKLSLWSYRVIKACSVFFDLFCRLSMSRLSSWAIDFACESMLLAASVLTFL